MFVVMYSKIYAYYKPSLAGNLKDIGGEVDPGWVEVFDSSTVTLFKDILKVAGRNPLSGKKKGGAKVYALPLELKKNGYVQK